MRNRDRFCVANVIAVGMAVLVSGCKTTSHATVRIYEEQSAPEVTREDERDPEWEMVSPGEMESPGKMEPPTTMQLEP